MERSGRLLEQILLAREPVAQDGIATYLIGEFRHHNTGHIILHPLSLQDDHVSSILCHPARYGSVVVCGENKSSIRAPSRAGYLGSIVARGLDDL